MCCLSMCGYTFYDLWPLLWHRKDEGWKGGVGMYVVHHVCTLASWGTAAASGYGHNVVVIVLFLEATGPFVNLRWFLSTHGLKDTTLYIVNGIIMFVLFFLLRVVFNWWIAITRFYVQRDAFFAQPGYIIACNLTLYPINLLLQLLWFQKILKGVLALIRGDGKKKKK